VRMARPAVLWQGGGEPPFPYGVAKTTVTLDKTAVMDEFKRTGEVPDGFKVERTTYLEIR
jgi:hypothetical protein